MTEVPTQEYVDALIEQRNRALDQAAVAMARSVYFQKEITALKQRIQQLETPAPQAGGA